MKAKHEIVPIVHYEDDDIFVVFSKNAPWDATEEESVKVASDTEARKLIKIFNKIKVEK